MMHAVVRRRYEDVFEPSHFAHKLRVHKNPPNLRGCKNKQDIHGLKSSQAQWNEINETVERLKNRGAKAYGEVELFRRVVRNVHCPEKTAEMIHTHGIIKPVPMAIDMALPIETPKIIPRTPPN